MREIAPRSQRRTTVAPTYFFDVSDILSYVRTESSISGIQRVSLELIKRISAQPGAANVMISFWTLDDRYVALPASYITDMPEFDTDRLSHMFFGTRARRMEQTAPTLARYRLRPLKYWVYSIVRHFKAAIGDEAHFVNKGCSIAEWKSYHAREHEVTPFPPQPKGQLVGDLVKPGDRVVVLGAVFGLSKLAKELERLKNDKQIDVTIFVHDLIPILAKEHLNGGFSHKFDNWLRNSTNYCSSYLANSCHTSRDLLSYLEKEGAPRPVKVVPLAQQFHRPDAAEEGAFSEQVRQILDHPFVLVVGTLEDRKNLLRLALAWQYLCVDENIATPKLIFAGKQNWQSPDFPDFMRQTKSLNGMVEIVNRPSDVELAALYSNCLFTAMVSLYEGWGLPIGESLSMGKTAVVARSTSMPEVGGDLVEYCDPLDVESIATACKTLIVDTAHRKALEGRIAQTRLRTWDDVAEEFIQALR
ncbi:MAG: glycosyl transferase family 1 [Sphingobium sp.]|nr:MAG: glycosyl transferase family 1 [Sphingobium sp.]